MSMRVLTLVIPEESGKSLLTDSRETPMEAILQRPTFHNELEKLIGT